MAIVLECFSCSIIIYVIALSSTVYSKFYFFPLFRGFPDHFDEGAMFAGGYQAAKLKEEFRQHFRNISRIMDCVGCDKCRLWGKLQVS